MSIRQTESDQSTRQTVIDGQIKSFIIEQIREEFGDQVDEISDKLDYLASHHSLRETRQGVTNILKAKKRDAKE